MAAICYRWPMNTGLVVAERYRLLGVLGEGGQATVHRARDERTGQMVAVKIVRGQGSKSRDMLARLAREQQAMVALAGTNAVKFIDMCSGPHGAVCLVMELLDGCDLEEYLTEIESQSRQIPAERVVEIIEPVVDTLEQAHSVGIVHRDIKPGNVFMLSAAAGGGTRLLDFGFAHLTSAEPLTQTGMVMGSPSYISPEMWLGTVEGADARADVYSLAVIIFRMLAGRLPFGGDTLMEKMHLATEAERPSLYGLRKELPRQVDIWVERALAIDPDERFKSVRASFGELLWALKLAPHPSKQRPPPAPTAEANKIRQWLETPVAVGTQAVASVWQAAANAVRGFFPLARRSSPAASKPAGKPAKAPPSSPPVPVNPLPPIPSPPPTAMPAIQSVADRPSAPSPSAPPSSPPPSSSTSGEASDSELTLLRDAETLLVAPAAGSETGEFSPPSDTKHAQPESSALEASAPASPSPPECGTEHGPSQTSAQSAPGSRVALNSSLPQTEVAESLTTEEASDKATEKPTTNKASNEVTATKKVSKKATAKKKTSKKAITKRASNEVTATKKKSKKTTAKKKTSKKTTAKKKASKKVPKKPAANKKASNKSTTKKKVSKKTTAKKKAPKKAAKTR